MEREQEPYMALVRASRVSSNRATLFDSEARHDNYVTLSIHRASRERRHGSDFVFEEGQLISVAMTESQWATMISSMNMGSGSPATLQRLMGEGIAPPPEPDNSREKFDADMIDIIEDVVKRIVELKKGKHTKATQHELDIIISHLRSNIPFITDQFDEHMEKRVDRAKVEIEAYMNAMVQRAGLATLANQPAQPQIEENTDD